MPPRKRSKRRVSTPAGDDDGMDIDVPTPDVEEPNETPTPEYDILKDPWTDEQEIALFKGIIKWKPNGMHKHFRMIALSEHMRNHGYDEKHTRIPGIWEKLKTLYNMDMIDAREDSFDDEEEDEARFIDFELPEEYYGVETFMRGKRGRHSEAPSSPPQLARSPSAPSTRSRKKEDPVPTAKAGASTVDDTDEARTSPPRSPPSKTTRAGRSATRSQVRAKAESTSRAPSKDTTIDEDDGEDETEATAEEEEQEAEEEERGESVELLDNPKPKAGRRPRKSKRKR